jgi:methylated-DNA-protein-cysteine methyltransferase-like protein
LPASQTYLKIWKAIKKIPRGKVATYGQIASLAGFAGHARLVGYALHATPDDVQIPWHRVINYQGRISLPKDEGQYDLQKALLEAEGIVFVHERINLKKYRWQPEL